ncbi:S-layer homology domain-containing protein [Caldicellulosiruptoraceae bacterium PP1]
MKKFKRLIAIVTVLLFALTIVAPAFAQDEATTNPVYDDAAKVLKDKGVLQGNENGDLMLDKTLTRAEVVTMILRATGQEDVAEEYADADASFSDTADHWAKKYIEAAKELGIVNGYPDGTFKPEAPIKFEELCKLLVAAANETPAAGKWPLNYVKKALDLGFFNGIEDEVGIGQVVVRGQAAVGFAAAFFPPEKPAPVVKDVQPGDNTSFVVTLEPAAGYTLEDGDVTAADFEVKDAADETKTLAVKDATLDVATGKVKVTTDPQVAGKTYKVFFRGQDTTKTFAGAPVDLTADVPNPDNLKSFTIKFNDEVDPATLVKNDTIKVDGKDIYDLKLLDDNKTVYVVLSDKFDQFTKYNVLINGVKSKFGKTLTNFSKEVSVLDSKQPEVTKVEALNPKQIKVTFSEPINETKSDLYSLRDKVKVNGLYITAKITSVDPLTNSIVFELYSALTKGTQNIEITGYQDFANYTMVAKQTTFDVQEDIKAPTLVKATFQDKQTIIVEFDEPLVSGTDSTVPYGTFKVNGNVATAKFVDNTNNTQVKLTLSPALSFGTLLAAITYQNQKDLVGNTVSTEQTYTLSITDDTIPPVINNIEVLDGNTVKVVFSKPMSKTDGTVTQGTTSNNVQSSWWTDDYTLQIPADKVGLASVNGGNYTIKFENFKDMSIRGNAMLTVEKPITAKDTVKPVVSDKFKVENGSTSDYDVVKIFFSEPMNRDTIANVSSYVYVDAGNNEYPLSAVSNFTGLTVASDNKSVTIGFKNARTFTTEKFKLFAMKDLAGNLIETNGVAVVSLIGSANALVINSAKATSATEVTVTFNNKIVSVDPRILKLKVGNSEFAFSSATIDTTNSNVVKFTATTNIPADTANTSISIWDSSKITDIYGQNYRNSTDTFVVNDGIAPTVTIATGDNSKQIKLTFSETVKATYDSQVYASIIMVKVADGSFVTLDSSNVAYGSGENKDGFKTLIITAPEATTDYYITVSPTYIKDALAGNAVEPQINVKVTSK